VRTVFSTGGGAIPAETGAFRCENFRSSGRSSGGSRRRTTSRTNSSTSGSRTRVAGCRYGVAKVFHPDAARLKAIGFEFGRAIWQIAVVKTCAAHGIALTIVIRDLTPGKLHDFAHHVAGVIPGLNRLVTEAVERPVSGLEAYVTGRLNAHAGPELLDQLPLYVAIDACELFGAVATLGRTPHLKRLTEQWHAAGAAGTGDALRFGLQRGLSQIAAGIAVFNPGFNTAIWSITFRPYP